MASRERVGLPSRASTRDGHAHAPVVFDTEQVSPGAAMAYEVDWGNRLHRGRRNLRIGGARKREPQLHADRIPRFVAPLDTPAVVGVIFIALVRGT